MAIGILISGNDRITMKDVHGSGLDGGVVILRNGEVIAEGVTGDTVVTSDRAQIIRDQLAKQFPEMHLGKVSVEDVQAAVLAVLRAYDRDEETSKAAKQKALQASRLGEVLAEGHFSGWANFVVAIMQLLK